MKTYHGVVNREGGGAVLATAPDGCYWLDRRTDLLDWEAAGLTTPDEHCRDLWLLAIDLIADATGQDDLALRAAPDLVPALHRQTDTADWVLFEEHLQQWVVDWVCWQLGLLPPEKEVARA